MYKFYFGALGKPVKNINTMSHPCGSYNQDTLEILKI